jgi:hypothetical protein
VTSRLKQFHSDTGEIPKSLRHINAELPVLGTTLLQIRQAIEADSVGDDTGDALIPVINGCQEQIEQLDVIIVKTLPAIKDSWKTKSKKAIVSLHQDEKVESIAKTVALSTLQPLTGE